MARFFAAALVLGLTAGCRSWSGPGDPERSIAGTYRGSWQFSVHEPDTLARPPDGSDRYRGYIACPAEFRVTEQDGKEIRGDFSLSAPGPFSACVSQQPGFCTNDIVATFCTPVSGTLVGEAFSTGAKTPTTILFTFRMRIPAAPAREAVGRFIGCPVVAQQTDIFKGGVANDANASAFAQATVACNGRAGLDRVDVTVSLSANRVVGQ